MAFLGWMALLVFGLLTAVGLLLAGMSERVHETWSAGTAQLLLGLAGIAMSVPLLLGGDGWGLLGLSVVNVLMGAHRVATGAPRCPRTARTPRRGSHPRA